MAHRPNDGTRWLNPDEVRSFLRRAGMDSSRKINEVLDGYDFSNKPLYFETLQEGQVLYQFIRNASVETGAPRTGNWGWAGGGVGGGTQVFVPPNYIGHLIAHGPDE